MRNTKTIVFGDISHRPVFDVDGVYASHPANHGHWQWGEELLVGFLTGRYADGAGSEGYHPVWKPYKKLQARSRDGGLNWKIEDPIVDFNAEIVTSTTSLNLDSQILRFCGVYDTGGEDCYRGGGVYTSADKGVSWQGPFEALGFADDEDFTARTCMIPELNLVLVTKRKFCRFGTDWIVVCRVDDGKLNPIAEIRVEGRRAAMPAAASDGQNIFVAARDINKILAFKSGDAGRTWVEMGAVANTGHANGNPPAVIYDKGILYLAYGNRSECSLEVIASDDFGNSWSRPAIVRSAGGNDFGYARLFSATHGLCVVYYHTKEAGGRATIESTILSGPMLRP